MKILVFGLILFACTLVRALESAPALSCGTKSCKKFVGACIGQLSQLFCVLVQRIRRGLLYMKAEEQGCRLQ